MHSLSQVLIHGGPVSFPEKDVYRHVEIDFCGVDPLDFVVGSIMNLWDFPFFVLTPWKSTIFPQILAKTHLSNVVKINITKF